ncbi:hypothetical protein B0H10DRAFT_2161872 [Mycena sp. CBHHK59/15]|nr:hypothetical protein B0H10DRAFT_2161872 [Mycena sp. CBHHK59/15]
MPDKFGYIPEDGEVDPLESDSNDEDPSAQEYQDAGRAGLEDGYEVPRSPAGPIDEDSNMPDSLGTLPAPTCKARKAAKDQFHHKPIVEKYPGASAGKPISSAPSETSEQRYKSSLESLTSTNPYAPFKSKMDWEIAKWVKLRGSGSTAFTDLLQIDGVRESLDLSYRTSPQLNKIIDEQLPGHPKFTRSEVVINSEVFHLYSRDILKCEAVEKDNPGATIIPIIISSNKTQLTIRQKPSRYGYVLLGYLPISHMKNVKNKAEAGVNGVPMMSGDGITRRGHPIYTIFVGDYPEQVLVVSVKTGECPTCEVPHDELGEDSTFHLHNLENILVALEKLDYGPSIYAAACEEAGIKPIYHPFWEGLPYTNIFQAISPDILHQLYQGIVKHLIAWLTECCGEAEIDACCQWLPPNHNIWLFMSGISNLSQVTGKEHDQISRFLLRLIIDVKLPAAVHGILDFVYLAQYPMHTSETLTHLENPLQRFHNNKSIFIDLRIRDYFNLPKLHVCCHYIMYIKLFDKFPQMTLWLEQKEKIYCTGVYVVGGRIKWQSRRQLKMTKNPGLKAVRLTHLVDDYGAMVFCNALARYVVHLNYPHLSHSQIETHSQDLTFSFNSIPVFHCIKFTTEDPYIARGPKDSVVDSIHVQPQKILKNGEVLPAQFDTALVNDGTGQMTGIRVFSPFTHLEPDHLMYKVNVIVVPQN